MNGQVSVNSDLLACILSYILDFGIQKLRHNLSFAGQFAIKHQKHNKYYNRANTVC